MNFFTVFTRELSWLFRHKGALLILMGAPLLYSLFYPLPYQHAVVDQIPLIVWDEENSDQTHAWIALLDAQPKLKVIAHLPGKPVADVWRRYPSVQAFIFFPDQLAEQLAHQQSVAIPYGARADNFLVYSEAAKALARSLSEFNHRLVLDELYQAEGNAVTAEQVALPINSHIIELFNVEASYMQYLVPAVFVIMVQQVLMITLGMHWGYRFEMGRPLGCAYRVWLSHTVLYASHGLILILFFFRIMLPWQGVPFTADPLVLFRAAVPFVLAVTGFAMVFTVGFREQETAIIWLLPLSIPALLVAGVSWPEFAMAPWVKLIAPVFPSTWGVNALLDVAFVGVEPNYFSGWAQAFVWLTLGGLARVLVVGTHRAENRSIA